MEMFVFLEDNDLWQEVVHPRKSPSSSLEPPGSPHFLLRSTWNYVFDHSDITNHVFSQFPQQEAKKNPHFLIFPRLTRKIYSPVKGKGAGISSSPSTFGRRRSELPPFFFLGSTWVGTSTFNNPLHFTQKLRCVGGASKKWKVLERRFSSV